MAVTAESSFEQITRGLGRDEDSIDAQQRSVDNVQAASNDGSSSLLIENEPLKHSKTDQLTRRRINGVPINASADRGGH